MQMNICIYICIHIQVVYSLDSPPGLLLPRLVRPMLETAANTLCWAAVRLAASGVHMVPRPTLQVPIPLLYNKKCEFHNYIPT